VWPLRSKRLKGCRWGEVLARTRDCPSSRVIVSKGRGAARRSRPARFPRPKVPRTRPVLEAWLDRRRRGSTRDPTPPGVHRILGSSGRPSATRRARSTSISTGPPRFGLGRRVTRFPGDSSQKRPSRFARVRCRTSAAVWRSRGSRGGREASASRAFCPESSQFSRLLAMLIERSSWRSAASLRASIQERWLSEASRSRTGTSTATTAKFSTTPGRVTERVLRGHRAHLSRGRKLASSEASAAFCMPLTRFFRASRLALPGLRCMGPEASA